MRGTVEGGRSGGGRGGGGAGVDRLYRSMIGGAAARHLASEARLTPHLHETAAVSSRSVRLTTEASHNLSLIALRVSHDFKSERDWRPRRAGR